MYGLAVCVLTCDRFEHTMRTVKSLLDNNWTELKRYGGDWDLYYFDDASTDERVVPFMDDMGFERTGLNIKRKGCSPSTELLLNRAAKRTTHDLILYLQNDQECCDILPTDNIYKLFNTHPEIGALRLFHEFKDKEKKSPISPRNLLEKTEASWQRVDGLPFESARIHWGLQPVVLRKELVPLVYTGIKREQDTFDNMHKLNYLCARTLRNYFYHIGQERTPNGDWGK